MGIPEGSLQQDPIEGGIAFAGNDNFVSGLCGWSLVSRFRKRPLDVSYRCRRRHADRPMTKSRTKRAEQCAQFIAFNGSGQNS